MESRYHHFSHTRMTDEFWAEDRVSCFAFYLLFIPLSVGVWGGGGGVVGLQDPSCSVARNEGGVRQMNDIMIFCNAPSCVSD